jgi:hypothetical protein
MILQELLNILKEYDPNTQVTIRGLSPESLTTTIFLPTTDDVIRSHLEFFDEDIGQLTINL